MLGRSAASRYGFRSVPKFILAVAGLALVQQNRAACDLKGETELLITWTDYAQHCRTPTQQQRPALIVFSCVRICSAGLFSNGTLLLKQSQLWITYNGRRRSHPRYLNWSRYRTRRDVLAVGFQYVTSKYRYNSSTMLISATLGTLLAPLQSECIFGFDQMLCNYNST